MDGSGGAIVTWKDNRSGSGYDIYAQHARITGDIDPAWPVDGRALCTAANDQNSPRIASDDAGGAIVAWSDTRSGSDDIYAQHILGDGSIDSAWPPNGLGVSTASGSQDAPVIVANSQRGAILSWLDGRNGYYDIYAQRVSFYGALTPVELGVPRFRNYAERARPNPFNPETKIPYTVSPGGRVTVKVYDSSGRLVRTVENLKRPAGSYVARWDGRTDVGTAVASGTYFGQITFPDGTHSEQKLTIIR